MRAHSLYHLLSTWQKTCEAQAPAGSSTHPEQLGAMAMQIAGLNPVQYEMSAARATVLIGVYTQSNFGKPKILCCSDCVLYVFVRSIIYVD